MYSRRMERGEAFPPCTEIVVDFTPGIWDSDDWLCEHHRVWNQHVCVKNLTRKLPVVKICRNKTVCLILFSFPVSMPSHISSHLIVIWQKGDLHSSVQKIRTLHCEDSSATKCLFTNTQIWVQFPGWCGPMYCDPSSGKWRQIDTWGFLVS